MYDAECDQQVTVVGRLFTALVRVHRRQVSTIVVACLSH